MLVRELMEQPKALLMPTHDIKDALPILQKTGDHALPVVENGIFRGVMALDVSLFYLFQENPFLQVQDVMEKDTPTVSPDQSLEELPTARQGLWPVIQDNMLIGILPLDKVRQALQQQLKQLSNHHSVLEALIESSYDGIYITDQNGVTLQVNRAIERITGLSKSELIGKSMKDLVKVGVFSESVTLKVLSERKPVTLIQRIKNGRRTMVTGNPVFDSNGEIIRVITNVRDITELNQLREELEQSQRRSESENLELEKVRTNEWRIHEIVAESKPMLDVVDLAILVAKVDTPVLILGETGVGKEVIAQLIHRRSPRNQKGRFLKINCGAIPEELLESELFGYESGAFTGARKEGKPGIFELAHQGTLLLDEIADLPQRLQVKLLRALQEQEFMRVGGTKPIRVNVRIIAATNKDLESMMQTGHFREDLYYRLNVIPIQVPPLRERKDDIIPLLDHFLNHFKKKYGVRKEFTNDLREKLMTYPWPGNVRELANLVERLVITCREEVITTSHLPGEYRRSWGAKKLDLPMSLKDTLANLEKEMIEKALRMNGSTYKAAKALGMSQSFVVKKAKHYGLCVNSK